MILVEFGGVVQERRQRRLIEPARPTAGAAQVGYQGGAVVQAATLVMAISPKTTLLLEKVSPSGEVKDVNTYHTRGSGSPMSYIEMPSPLE